MKFEGSLYEITAEKIAADSFSAEYTIRLNSSHVIFGGHFPGRPVLPGVCIMQITGELANRMAAKPLEPRKFSNVKFLAPVEPCDGLSISVNISHDSSTGKIRSQWTVGETIAAKISAICDV